MDKLIYVIIITLAIGLVAFFIGPILWPPMSGVEPTSLQLPFFIFLSALEALLFGFGIALIYIALPYLKKVPKIYKTKTYLAFISLIWLLISWWPHDNLHKMIGLDMGKLLLIEYGFHFTLIIASLILTYYFLDSNKINIKK